LAGQLAPAMRGVVRRRADTTTPVPTRPWAHPHYWAPFILIGDPGEPIHRPDAK
jgi:CHAT domain-containing protein